MFLKKNSAESGGKVILEEAAIEVMELNCGSGFVIDERTRNLHMNWLTCVYIGS